MLGLSASNQVSVLNHRLPKYGIYFKYTALEHVVACLGCIQVEHLVADCDYICGGLCGDVVVEYVAWCVVLGMGLCNFCGRLV